MDLPLRTERLVIRTLEPRDLDAFVAYRTDPDIGRYQDWALPYTLEAARSLFDRQAALTGPTDGEGVQLAIEYGGEIVGDLYVELRHGGDIAVLGYTLSTAHQGKGFATEAVTRLVDALVDDGVHRIVATLDPENVPSMRVLEAIGFTFESFAPKAEFVRGEWVDDLRYSLLAEDRVAWRTRSLVTPDVVRFVEITPEDAYLWGRLKTHHSQERYVATMPLTFRDALFPEVIDGAPVVPWMRGVMGDDERVGFVMIAEVTDHHPEPYLWRLLVDRMHQRRGIGTRILAELCATLRDQGHATLLTSWGEGPGSPRPFYERFGFVPTGRQIDDETEARLTL